MNDNKSIKKKGTIYFIISAFNIRRNLWNIMWEIQLEDLNMSLTNSNIFTMKLKGLLLLSGLLLSTITLSMNGSYQRVNADGDFIYGEKIDNPGATYRTQRVWLNNENTYFYDNDEFDW